MALHALVPTEVRGQAPPVEVVRAELITEARAASRAGDHPRAIDRASRAWQLRGTPSLAYLLAREHLAAGHAVEALTWATTCERGAEADVALRDRAALRATCGELRASSDARVGRITLRLGAPPPGFRVELDGAAMPVALLGLPYPVEPGVVRLRAEAPGHREVAEDVQVAAGSSVEVTIAMEPLPQAPPPQTTAPYTTPPQTTAPQTTLQLPPAEAPSVPQAAPPLGPHGPLRTPTAPLVGPWVLFGSGAGALLLGLGFYALASSQRAERDLRCPAEPALPCPDAEGASDYDDRYRGLLVATNASFVVGATALLGGALWWWLSSPRARDRRRGALSLHGGPGTLVVTLRGAW
ncbi:MAG: hypothetical protein HY909_12415 [Deltaproteobacteria bacterium]|nr:hypothetical protein [Deltaproteobacteria bacterium]